MSGGGSVFAISNLKNLILSALISHIYLQDEVKLLSEASKKMWQWILV